MKSRDGAWLGQVSLGEARLGVGEEWRGSAWLVAGCRGVHRLGAVWHGALVAVTRREGTENGPGLAGQVAAGIGKAGSGMAWRGEARQGQARPGEQGHGRFGASPSRGETRGGHRE